MSLWFKWDCISFVTVTPARVDHYHNHTYLEYTLMSGMLLQFNQTIKNNQLHVVVTLLYDQINVALGSSLESNEAQKA